MASEKSVFIATAPARLALVKSRLVARDVCAGTQIGLEQVGADHDCAGEEAASQVGAGHAGILQVRLAEVAGEQGGAVEAGAAQIGAEERRTGEVGVRHVAADHAETGQIVADQHRAMPPARFTEQRVQPHRLVELCLRQPDQLLGRITTQRRLNPR